jgi:predicted patatin/cPLA2 family phospholipase
VSVRTATVVEILRARVARGSRPPHDDGASVALAVEGGAMRGVISAGMVTALEELGYGDAFDAVYGSSAGAINAAYFLAGQAGLGTTIYHQDINNRRFIDLSRPLRGRSIVDLAFLLDDVARRRKRLDTDRVLGARAGLTILATDVAREASCAFTRFTNADDLFHAMRAGATMPIIAGGPYFYDDRLCLDASLSEPIPVPTAESAGHTHVVVLLTRSGAMRPRPSGLDRYFVGPRLRRLSPGLAARYLGRSVPYAELLAAIDTGWGPQRRAAVLPVRVDGLHVSRLECRQHVLQAAARRGYDAVVELFGPPR